MNLKSMIQHLLLIYKLMRNKVTMVEDISITPEQRKAVEDAQNRSRGRGRIKLGRENVHFAADAKLVQKVKAIHYEHGITLNMLYNEALGLLVDKYGK